MEYWRKKRLMRRMEERKRTTVWGAGGVAGDDKNEPLLYAPVYKGGKGGGLFSLIELCGYHQMATSAPQCNLHLSYQSNLLINDLA